MKNIVFLTLLLLITAQTPTCNKGGLICDQNKCHYPEYIEGCLAYAVDSKCVQCEYNYQLQNGLCFYNAKNNQPCCLAFDSNSKCTECAGGLQLNPINNNCQDIKIIGCLQKNIRGCSICAYNFDLVAGRCVPSIQRCISYDVQNRCTICNNISTLVSGFCVPNMQLPLFSNCKLQNEYGCAECNSGYRVDSQENCQLGINGCLLYNPIGECLRCDAPSFELVDGTCRVVGCLNFIKGVCNSCDSTLGFQLFNNLCQIPNCTYFNRGGCLICASGLVVGPSGCTRPSPPVCLICKSDEYLGANSKCYKRDVHCVQYKSGVCTVCCEGFFLDAAFGCQPIVPGCIYNKGVCASCSSPFTFVNSTCAILGCVQYYKDGCISCDSRLNLIANACGLPNCQQFSVEFKCRQCNAGYALDQSGKCIVVDPNCLTRNNLNICLKCKEGFQIGQDGKCFSVKVGCNYIDGRCTSCRAPFIYIPTSESCEIDGCLSYFVGGCEKCENEYTLLYNSCKLPKCLISKKGKCIQCDPDQTFRSDGTCVSKDEYCDKMDINGTCIKCMESYYYSQKLLKCVKKSPGCNYDNQDKCISCEAPFTYQPGRCVIKGCLNFNKDGCYECEYPFSLTKTKSCQIANCLSYATDGHCSSCVAGYALSKEFICQIQDQNCKQYNILRTTCLTCIKGYRLDSRGRCQYADEYCTSFDYGICMNCDRLYFLNYFGKCQLRDPQCLIYTNGYCSSCKSYYFPKDGFCMPNFIGCKIQQSYGKCLTCDDGYQLSKGNCVGTITRLNWNSVNMDFDEDDQSSKLPNSKAQSVFTVGVTSTLNLIAAFGTGKGRLFFSSSVLNDAIVLLKSVGNNGWSPSGRNPLGQFVGFQAKNLQTFYACDIKPLTGSTLESFILEYSMDGQSYIQIGEFSMKDSAIDSIITFYFKPVYAKFIRLVVKKGTPNIRVEFYYSSAQKLASASSISYDNTTFISRTVVAIIDGVENGGINKCDKSSLCWAGIESCQPRNIKGFSLLYNGNNTDKVTEVKIEYSTDALNFVCWNNCTSIVLSNDGLVFPSPILAEKVHVHFTKYSGNPKFGIQFNYA